MKIIENLSISLFHIFVHLTQEVPESFSKGRERCLRVVIRIAEITRTTDTP